MIRIPNCSATALISRRCRVSSRRTSATSAQTLVAVSTWARMSSLTTCPVTCSWQAGMKPAGGSTASSSVSASTRRYSSSTPSVKLGWSRSRLMSFNPRVNRRNCSVRTIPANSDSFLRAGVSRRFLRGVSPASPERFQAPSQAPLRQVRRLAQNRPARLPCRPIVPRPARTRSRAGTLSWTRLLTPATIRALPPWRAPSTTTAGSYRSR